MCDPSSLIHHFSYCSIYPLPPDFLFHLVLWMNDISSSKNRKDGPVRSGERKTANPSRNPWKSPASFSCPPASSVTERGQGKWAEEEGQRRKDSGVMSRWWRALGSLLPLFGANGVGGQQREAQEKGRKLSFRRKLLSHGDKPQTASIAQWKSD